MFITFIMMRRTARPIVALARVALAERVVAVVHAEARRDGAVDDHDHGRAARAAGGPVVGEVADGKAPTAATTTGMYSGGSPP